MAAVKGVNRTKADTPTPDNTLEKGMARGRVRCMLDTYEASALASGSTISMGDTLPDGAKIVGVSFNADALGSGVTLKLGDSNDDDRYLVSAVYHTANKNNQAIATDGLLYKIGTNSGDNQILITTGGASATGTINLAVFFTED